MVIDMKTGKIQLILSFVLLLTFCQSNICLSQQKYGDLVIGDKIHFESKILNEQKTIVVIPPYNYKDMPNEKFPVVYVLDVGNNLFATFGIINYYSVVLNVIFGQSDHPVPI